MALQSVPGHAPAEGDPMTPEWMQQMCAKAMEEAQPELDDISSMAADRHGAHQIALTQKDAACLGLAIAEIQRQSFLLGMTTAIKMVTDIAARAEEQVQ